MGAFFRFTSLTSRITGLVLLTLAVFTIALGVTAFQITRDWLENTAVANLEALASARQAAINIQLDHYTAHLEGFIQPNLEIDVAHLLETSGFERTALYEELVAELRREQKVDANIVWIDIVDPDSTVFVSTDSERQGFNYGKTGVFIKGERQVFISEPFADSGVIYLELSSPVNDSKNYTIAVLVIRFNARQLLAITGDYTGLGETGETVLGARRGDEIHFLAPLRFDPNLSDIAPAPVDGELAKPMIHATAGQSGKISAPDYRDVQVIAAYRPIELTGWGLVVKQDEAETYASVSRLRESLLIGLVVLLVVGTALTLPLARTFTRPVRELERATRQVASGDMTTSVPISQLDEVGQLAESFNTMVSQLREAYDELERSNQELASFAYVVSHDLKAPLRGISSLSEWLQEDLQGKLEDEQIEQMRLLRERVWRMDTLINDLLQYSRVGRVRNPAVSVEVESLLARVIDNVHPPDHIQVSVIPPTPTLHTDEMRLSQVFQNLIENAVNFHPGPQGLVEVSCRETGEHWEFSVSDDGTGIEPRHHERIFQIFQSLQPLDDPESTGIGLALVRKIVREHGGDIWVESDGADGSGAIFRFTWQK